MNKDIFIRDILILLVAVCFIVERFLQYMDAPIGALVAARVVMVVCACIPLALTCRQKGKIVVGWKKWLYFLAPAAVFLVLGGIWVSALFWN